MIQPQNDRVLIQRVEEKVSRETLSLTDRSKSIKGLVLAVGPGKWIKGTWWKVGVWCRWHEGGYVKVTPPENDENDGWEWIPGHREPLAVKPGMKVLFNSKWNDFTHAENKGTGADLTGPLERPLPLSADPLLHLIQEADIFAIVDHFDFKAEMGRTVLEETFFRSVTTVEAS